jgi:hypothetical protein
MIYDCIFCQSKLKKDGIELVCSSCPIKVSHYLNLNDFIFCSELSYKEYLITIYLTDFNGSPISDNEVMFISKLNGHNSVQIFASDFGITPSNVKEKLQTILTFQ